VAPRLFRPPHRRGDARSATSLDRRYKTVAFDDGSSRAFDAILLATGAEPVRLRLPGGDLPHVHYLRTLADSGAIIADARALIAYRKGGRILAVATVFMDAESLAIEAAFERGDLREVERIVKSVS
jgi:NAD(P)H-nitrite reductase large subunit